MGEGRVEILVDCTWVNRDGGGVASRCSGGSTGGTPLSRTEGSTGGEPSKAHLRDSYFDLMNDSILLVYSQKPMNK